MMLTLISFLLAFQIQVSGWDIFVNTKYETHYIEELNMEAELPVFDDAIKSLEGTEITLTGYYLPIDIDGNRIILSKLPYASCFFCGGGGGLESVAEIQFEETPRKFTIDELLTVKGQLKLNEREHGHLVFILTHAVVISD